MAIRPYKLKVMHKYHYSLFTIHYSLFTIHSLLEQITNNPLKGIGNEREIKAIFLPGAIAGLEIN